jgi:adenosylcobinamide-phosphate synthase
LFDILFGSRFGLISTAIAAGFIIDLILGDPRWMPHPVVIIGKCITLLERFFRKIMPKSHAGEFIGGLFMTIIIVGGTFGITFALCELAYRYNKWVFLALETLWCWQCVAIRDLKVESMAVYRKLKEGDLEGARKAVGRIVGRDTQELTDIGVTKAALETIAENFADGVLAPVLYMMILGAPLAMTYKAINTIDSMCGYKNERYLYFGKAGAHLDDVVGWIPARLAALVWILAAGLTGNDMKNAWKIWRRDHSKSASPNSSHTESACAGSLDIQLLGPAYYFGEYYDKQYVGDPIRPVEYEDIKRANVMMYVSAVITYAVGIALRYIIWRVI